MGNETAKKILCYTLTPQILPRIGTLFFSGFSYIAFFMARVYWVARLLPEGHPYLNASNMGRFGIRHVVAEAASRLVWKKENIDQIVIFSMLLVGIVLLFFQICMLGLGLFITSAYAFGGPSTFAAYFLVPDATHDVAFVILDRVFGVPNFFVDAGGGQTCVVTGQPCFDIGQSTRVITPDNTVYTQIAINNGVIIPTAPVNLAFPWPLHIAMHKMFEFYSIGLLLIAMFILIYFVAAVVVETAQTGTAFGQRFNHVWAPLRIVAGIGALVPLPGAYDTVSLNSVQYILLWSAKWGSGFATNGWIYFNDMAIGGTDTLLGSTETLVVWPNAPPINTLLEFYSTVATCKIATETMYHQRDDRDPVIIEAWLVNPNQASLIPLPLFGTTFEAALEYFNYGDIIVRFGELRDQEHQTRDGRVKPTCGEVKLMITDVDMVAYPGAYNILATYYAELLVMFWTRASANVGAGCSYNSDLTFEACLGFNVARRYLPIFHDPNAPLPNSQQLDSHRQWIQDTIQDFIDNIAVPDQQGSPEWLEQLNELGWGGAAVWYNKVAQLNGSLIGASYSIPVVQKYPDVMEKVLNSKGGSDTDLNGQTRFQVYRGPDAPIYLSDEEETPIGKALFFAQNVWRDHYSERTQGGNIYMDVINAIFGTAGLFDLQRQGDLAIHPLAQLAGIGRSILDSSISNLGYSAAAGMGGGIMNLFGEHLVGRVGMAASSFLTQIALTGFTVGFVLYYIIPLLPFIYFFFAVGGWVKGIFEAMVGVPLWAMAHIRIDGYGLPGDAALGGYYLVLEVFLRPILIVFGFLASITIFAAQVRVLHEIWPLVVSNASGFDVNASLTKYDVNQTGGMRFLRGAIDKFFYTVIYAIMVYMLGMASFKLIDLIPNHILRWMGASVSTFGDQSGDPAENLVRNSFIGANMVSSPIGQALSGVKGAAEHGGQAIMELAGRAAK